MLTHRDFSAWIEINSNPVEEHGVIVNESASRISGWIPVEEGHYFTVHWSDHGGKVTTCSFIFLDGGNPIPGQFLFGNGTAWRGGVRTSDRTERPFMFQNVSDAGPSTTVQSAESGTIVLKIKRVTLVGEQPPNAIEPVPTVLGNSPAGDLSIGLGMELKAPRRIHKTFKVVSYENPQEAQPSTYVTFVFRYRTKAFLISKGIIATEAKVPTSAPGKDQVNKKKRTASGRGDTNPGPLVAAEEEQTSFTDSGANKRPAKKLKIKAGSVPDGTALSDTNRSTMPSSTVFAPVLTGLPRPSEEMQTRWNMGPPPSMAESSSAGQGRFFLPGPVPAVDTTHFPPPTIHSFSAMRAVSRDSTPVSAQPSFAPPTVHTGNDASQHFLPAPFPAMDTAYFPPPMLQSFSAMRTVSGGSTSSPISAQPSIASPTVHTGNDATQYALPAPVPDTDGPKCYTMAALLAASRGDTPLSSLDSSMIPTPDEDSLDQYFSLPPPHSKEAVFPPFFPYF